MLYINKNEKIGANSVALDDMILTKDLPTTAGSRMLENFTSLFEAEVVTRLTAAGYDIAGKANVGEFSLDILGESSYFGAVCSDGKLQNASAELVKSAEVKAALNLDVNGAPRRAAAIEGLVFVKPTYGTVSRYGTIPAVCSGESVGVMAKNSADAKEILAAIAGHDDKDGTSLPEADCAKIKESAQIKKVALIKSFGADIDAEIASKIEAAKAKMEADQITVDEIDCDILLAAKTAWNILMSAELCNNVSRYDGVKYGYRTANYNTIDELYTNSRTEAFGFLTKSVILYGSDTLSTENYDKVYDKALRVRRVLTEAFAKIFADYDAVLLPACSKAFFTEAEVKADPYISLSENLYTAPASITGLPAVVAGGVQLIGKALSDGALLELARVIE